MCVHAVSAQAYALAAEPNKPQARRVVHGLEYSEVLAKLAKLMSF